MITISCYGVHSLVAKFLMLWRWTQAISDWLTFFITMSCCQCLTLSPLKDSSSDNDSISCYKMLSVHSDFLKAGEPLSHISRVRLHSDSELQIRNHLLPAASSNEALETTDSGITSGPSMEQACGDPRRQQVIVDFAPAVGDAELELRNQVYDLESSHGSGSIGTSESGSGLPKSHGTRGDQLQHHSRYSQESETEVEITNHLPEPKSSRDIMNHYYDMLLNLNKSSVQQVPVSTSSRVKPTEIIEDKSVKIDSKLIASSGGKSQVWEFISRLQSSNKTRTETGADQPSQSILESADEVEIQSCAFSVSNDDESLIIDKKAMNSYGTSNGSSWLPTDCNFPATHSASRRKNKPPITNPDSGDPTQ